jgi:hypothetical protein
VNYHNGLAGQHQEAAQLVSQTTICKNMYFEQLLFDAVQLFPEKTPTVKF